MVDTAWTWHGDTVLPSIRWSVSYFQLSHVSSDSCIVTMMASSWPWDCVCINGRDSRLGSRLFVGGSVTLS